MLSEITQGLHPYGWKLHLIYYAKTLSTKGFHWKYSEKNHSKELLTNLYFKAQF